MWDFDTGTQLPTYFRTTGVELFSRDQAVITGLQFQGQILETRRLGMSSLQC